MWVKKSGGIFITIVMIFVALILRLYAVTFGLEGQRAIKVSGNRIRTTTLYNTKATIYDENLNMITNYEKAYYMLINPRTFDKNKTEKVANYAKISASDLEKKLKTDKMFVLMSDSEPEKINGVYVFEGTKRYSSNNVAEHLLGYLDSNGEVGLSGLEKAYNSELSYFQNKKTITYTSDARNNIIAGLGIEQTSSGQNTKNGIILTINKDLNEKLEELMDKYIEKGAAVIINSMTGEIKAMSSKPSFNQYNVSQYINSDNGELVNRATSLMPVGSVFKIVVAAAAIEKGIDNFEYDCSGGIKVSDRVFACHNENGHGKVNLKEAFANSCNSYFIALGQLVGIDAINEMAKKMGFDDTITIAKGMSFKSGKLTKSSNSAWECANYSIGQGDLLASPLQIARMMAIVANGGYKVNPSVYKGMYINGKINSNIMVSPSTKVIDDKIADKLKELCIYTVENGTGKSSKPDEFGAGGKTASAQTGVIKDKKEVLNTYFAGFYPADMPEYVIVVYAQDGESGAKTCGPVFKEICNFLNNR